MSRTNIPGTTIERFLQEKGFVRGVRGHEVTYEKLNHNNSCAKVIVYTSLGVGELVVRDTGKDAIRVLLLGKMPDGKWICLNKSKRVHRTGTVEAVLERMLERMRESYALANQFAKHPCLKCRGCTWPDSGRCVSIRCRETK